ncbi:hypothetical protein ABZ422_20015 [Micromonospora zamorensis]|uniref:hypothetical protein n=1 Tax=Micromonospora zamorensis TaxID=709883 RepID=UPI0033CA98FB
MQTRDAFTVAQRVPDDSTLSRVLTGIDAGALDAAVCRWLLSRAVLTGAGRRVIAVDGKTLRGSGPTGAQVHLLAALDQAEQIGLAQINVAQQPREQFSGNSRGDGASWQVTEDEMIADVVAETPRRALSPGGSRPASPSTTPCRTIDSAGYHCAGPTST